MNPSARRLLLAIGMMLAAPVAADPLPMTQLDFKVPGTQVGDVPANHARSASECRVCHGGYSPETEPHDTWAGSLMALGGRDPLFFAQMTTANQDVANVGSFCLRCHVPVAVGTGHVLQANGSTLTAIDQEGVNCHFCHTMVDPQYQAGVSPVEDQAILAVLDEVPAFFGNAMFVLDPQDRRRGPRADVAPPHAALVSPFHRRSAMCGTCHDVGNVATTRQPDGSWRYNLLNAPAPDPDPQGQFPLERTYTEWKLSAFAAGGVNLGGRFGGARGPTVSTCQDCHMPTASGSACSWGALRNDLPSHEFAGAAVQSLDLIAAHTANDPNIDQSAIAAGRARALSMLQRAADVELSLTGNDLTARVINHSGHKLPTGHIEGRRVWLNLRFLDAAGGLLAEKGAYDAATATLDETSTTVYEMLVGLSPEAAAITGHPAGQTSHMALADSIVKDTRIPPRGFANASFEAAGAPVVGIAYADGQYWHEHTVNLPAGTDRILATLYYQGLTRGYVEHLREANTTDQWGETLHTLWQQTGRGAPIRMAQASLSLGDTLLRDGFEDD
ncbi:MAG: hypothetical protein AB7E72_19795 [Lysobacterales bacterium]